MEQTPKHIAFIMDGNRRWARAKGLPVGFGHSRGLKNFEKTVELCLQAGIEYATFYAFSTENWERKESEVKGILELLENNYSRLIKKGIKKGIRYNILGDTKRLKKEVASNLQKSILKSKENDKMTVNVAFDYGGRDEIAKAARECQKRQVKITPKNIEKYLYTKGQPDPDMIVRTGGEKRISNYLTWQSVYSELYFTKTLWPDFNKKEFNRALKEYSNRIRRFGK